MPFLCSPESGLRSGIPLTHYGYLEIAGVGRLSLAIPLRSARIPANEVRKADLPAALLEEVIDQLARGVVHLDVERFDLIGEVVERHNGRDRNQQTESRGDQ